MGIPAWTADQWIALVACTGEFLFAGVALTRRDPDRLATLAGILSLDIGAWNFAEFAYSVSGQLTWQWLDVSASPWTPALALGFVVTFVGQRRRHRRWLRLTYAGFGMLSSVGILAFFLHPFRQVVLGPWWSAIFLVLLVPTTAFLIWLLLEHLRRLPRGLERDRTLLLTAGLGIACAGGLTDLLAGVGAPVPRLATLGVLAGNGVLLVVALRLRLLDEAPPTQRMFVALALALGATAVLVSGFRALPPRPAVQLFASLALITLLLGLGVPLWRRGHRAAQRLLPLVTLGRMSDQLAHDLLNPLAALDGTVALLRHDLARGAVVEERHVQQLERLDQQVERMKRVIERYRRLGVMKVETRPVDTGVLLQRELATDHLARQGIELRTMLASGPLEAMLDEEIFSVIVHNLVRNAIEAMPEGGTLTIRAEAVQTPVPGVRLQIEDTGCGMNARVLDRAFEEHFTTKPSGTGLGLAFVRQAVEAHQGTVQLHSREGQGTRVELFFPGQKT
ncbi:MAG TPA: HAMP domain-containing sensor histidine kinase [Myxococcaceae bacterium]|nr:HAMP domain-containing sensor histidine kinase [Myxococcaceae bacterium]